MEVYPKGQVSGSHGIDMSEVDKGIEYLGDYLKVLKEDTNYYSQKLVRKVLEPYGKVYDERELFGIVYWGGENLVSLYSSAVRALKYFREELDLLYPDLQVVKSTSRFLEDFISKFQDRVEDDSRVLFEVIPHTNFYYKGVELDALKREFSKDTDTLQLALSYRDKFREWEKELEYGFKRVKGN